MYFYDTCALLNLQDKVFEEPFYISHVTLRELESIKVSRNKDDEVKYKARRMARLLKDNIGKYKVAQECVYRSYNIDPTKQPDMAILYDYQDTRLQWNSKKDKIYLVTDDINLFNFASTRGWPLITSADICGDDEEYMGWRYFEGGDDALAVFYEDLTKNTQNLAVNEYVFVPEIQGGTSGYRWTGEEYQLLYSKPLKTQQFGSDFRAKDICQRAAIDSIMHNQVTCIAGPAGSGKSYVSLVSAFDLMERGLYDRIIMLVNPAKAYGAVDMGFYPGTVYDKMLECFVGHMLETKLGDRFEIDRLLDCNKLQLISMADMRGMEIREREILYITECQNTSVELLKLCLTRVGEGAKVIIEGDFKSQVDSRAFCGERNGMKRVIDVLKGSSLFGYVRLERVWRSELAQLIEAM